MANNQTPPPDLNDLSVILDLLLDALEHSWGGHLPFRQLELSIIMLQIFIRKFVRWEDEFYKK